MCDSLFNSGPFAPLDNEKRIWRERERRKREGREEERAGRSEEM